MRLWSIHPEYLDAKGLVALWRESLLAQKVLCGKTKGYQNHPQLIRFKEYSNSNGAIASYLRAIADEADKRGYKFDRSKINSGRIQKRFDVASGQIKYEFSHLLKKLKIREPSRYHAMRPVSKIKPHPLFKEVPGSIASWENVDALTGSE